ncbi:MAG: lipid-binding SYLF domain-containing protein [Bryobacterales bacterium]|nr:lipid-binding SYLF domain-containing protein [Bryobacterales bacterium]MBV9397388.1 lipid-binding SYLF domain-containing protein [Bryobacterales bacterium]
MTAPLWAESKEDTEKRIREAGAVLKELTEAGDKAIPRDFLERAQCVGVVPGLKRAGFLVGAQYGKGVVTCRTTGPSGWSAPATVRIEGGSVGAQIGAGETDLVFVVMNQRGMDRLMQDKFTVGADAAAMAGPIGRTATAQTDAQLHAEILSWSRSRGVFAGVTLNGATLRPDKDDNRNLYGDVTLKQILTGEVMPTPAASALLTQLGTFPPHKG